MADRLTFVGQDFKVIDVAEGAISITIRSNFPTIANAGVQLFRDNGNNTISQIGQGRVIDTSINTPEGDTTLYSLPGSGKFALAFNGNATAIDGTAVTVMFEVHTSGGRLLENFGGARTAPGPVAPIAGSAFIITSDIGETA